MSNVQVTINGTITHPKFKFLWFWVGGKTHRVKESFTMPVGAHWGKDFGLVEVSATTSGEVAKLEVTAMDGAIAITSFTWDVARQSSGHVTHKIGSVKLDLDIKVVPI